MNRSQGVMAGAVRTRVTWAARFGWVSLLFMTCAVQPVRADLGLTNMRLTATLLANSCSVSTGTQEQTVELGTWPSKQFAVGSQSPNPTRFEIVLRTAASRHLASRSRFMAARQWGIVRCSRLMPVAVRRMLPWRYWIANAVGCHLGN